MADPSHQRAASIVSGISTSMRSVASPADVGAGTPRRGPGRRTLAELVYGGRDPTVAGYRAPTVRDIPQLHLPKLQPVADAEFERYLADLGPESDGIELAEVAAPALQNLDSVPAIFFDENFDLNNPRVFDSVSEAQPRRGSASRPSDETPAVPAADGGLANGAPNSDNNGAGAESVPLPDSTLLQEKLSWYIDTVELHLIHQISQASGSFFSTTAQFNDIEHRAGGVALRVHELRQSLEAIQRDIVGTTSQRFEWADKLERTLTLAQALDQLTLLLEQTALAADLAARGEPSRALELAEAADAFARGRVDAPLAAEWAREFRYPLADLSLLRALGPTFREIDALRSRVATSYRERLGQLLITDLLEHMAAVPPHETLVRLGKVLKVPHARGRRGPGGSEASPAYLEISPELRSELATAIENAQQAHVLDAALATFREDAVVELKSIIRAQLPSRAASEAAAAANSDRDRDRDEQLTGLGLSLKLMSATDAEAMAKNLIVHLSEVLRRLSTQRKVLLDITSSVETSNPVDVGNLLESAVLTSDSRVMRVFRTRREQNAQLPLPEFIRLYALTGMFMSECESVSGVYPPELSAYLQSETRNYISRLHERQVQALADALAKDVWKKEEVPSDTQTSIDHIVEAGSVDPSAWLKLWRGVIDADQPDANSAPSTLTKVQTASVEGEAFYTPRSVWKLAALLEENLTFMCLLPQVTADATANILSLLKQFDETTRSLILGAEAMKSGVLRRITFRHMSMASESLGWAMALSPFIKKCIQRHTTNEANTQAKEFDVLVANLAVHQEDIHQKFISLMTDKVAAVSRAIASTNWTPRPEPANAYMVSMVKDLSVVLKILEETIVSKSTTQTIMARIYDVFKPRLLEAYNTITLRTDEQKEHVLIDVGYLRDKMNGTLGIGNLAEIIYMTVEGLFVSEASGLTPRTSIDARRSMSPVRPPMPERPSADVNRSEPKTISIDESFADTSTVSQAGESADQSVSGAVLPELLINGKPTPPHSPQVVPAESERVTPALVEEDSPDVGLTAGESSEHLSSEANEPQEVTSPTAQSLEQHAEAAAFARPSVPAAAKQITAKPVDASSTTESALVDSSGTNDAVNHSSKTEEATTGSQSGQEVINGGDGHSDIQLAQHVQTGEFSGAKPTATDQNSDDAAKVQILETSELGEPVKPAVPFESVESVEPVEPVEPVESADPVDPVESLQEQVSNSAADVANGSTEELSTAAKGQAESHLEVKSTEASSPIAGNLETREPGAEVTTGTNSFNISAPEGGVNEAEKEDTAAVPATPVKDNSAKKKKKKKNGRGKK